MTPLSDTPLTVLVVDDDLHVRELLRSYLEQRGMLSIIVDSAEAALARTDLDHVDVAMLDIRLAGEIDGHALQKELNRLYPDMAKILMSGQADLDDVIAAFSDEAFSFARKPFSSLKEIGILIQRAAETKRLEKQNRLYRAKLEEANAVLSGRVSESAAEAHRYQKILAHLFHVSARISSIQQADSVLDFICQAVVEAGAFRRAVILLGDDKYLIQHVGIWQEGDIPQSVREQLRSLAGQPLRPYEFERTEERIGSAVLRRYDLALNSKASASEPASAGNQLFLPVSREDGSVFGFLTVEAPTDGTRPSADIVQLLDILLMHGALHLQAQRMRDELKRRAAELELRVHERTRELRVSEERFSRLVNSTTDIVYVADAEDRLVFVNEAFTHILGYVRENYIGRTLRKLLEEISTDNPINHRAMLELAQQMSEHSMHHVEVLSRQGDKRTLEINRTIVRQGGVVTGTQGIIRDITEHRVLLQQLVSSERLAATGKLAAGIAHEINNPLQGLSSQVAAIQKKIGPIEDVTENLDLLQDGIARIRDIVRGLLDLHRGSVSNHAPINLNEIARKVALLTTQQARDHEVVLKTELSKDIPTVMGSAQEIQQVILNLLINGIEAMPHGGELVVATSATPANVQLSVRDTGVGIAAEHLSQVFEPFFTFKPVGAGTGLGLYLCKNIMDMHNGSISVESEKGKGARFTLTFPLE